MKIVRTGDIPPLWILRDHHFLDCFVRAVCWQEPLLRAGVFQLQRRVISLKISMES